MNNAITMELKEITTTNPSTTSSHQQQQVITSPTNNNIMNEQSNITPNSESLLRKSVDFVDTSHLFRSRRTIRIIKSIPKRRELRTWRQKLYLILEHPRSSYTAMIFTILSSLLTVIQTLCLILRSFPFFFQFEVMWLIITGILSFLFMIEYFLRMIAKVYTVGDFKHFIRSPLNIIDVLSFVPFYIDLIIYLCDINTNITLQTVMVFRVLKLLKLIRLTRYSAKFQLLVVSLRRSYDMLVSIMLIVFMGALICSTLVYYAERGFYDSKSGMWLRSDGSPSPFSNILVCMWYSVVTIATVGYGDMAPITLIGRVVAIATILCGVIIIALPSMVVGGIYGQVSKEYEEEVNSKKLLRLGRKQQQQLQQKGVNGGVNSNGVMQKQQQTVEEEEDEDDSDIEFDVIDQHDTDGILFPELLMGSSIQPPSMQQQNNNSGGSLNNNSPTNSFKSEDGNHGLFLPPPLIPSNLQQRSNSMMTNNNSAVNNNSILNNFIQQSAMMENLFIKFPPVNVNDSKAAEVLYGRQDEIIKNCTKQLDELKQLAAEIKRRKQQFM
ncbi:hypothetical protein ABK040_005570 [Willaertia magna]